MLGELKLGVVKNSLNALYVGYQILEAIKEWNIDFSDFDELDGEDYQIMSVIYEMTRNLQNFEHEFKRLNRMFRDYMGR